MRAITMETRRESVDRALPPLTDEERAVYAWQMDVPGFGEAGQRALKGASVLVSRCGGLGGVVALELAAAGVGRLVIAHGGVVKPSDLNRQLLMTHAGIGSPRIDSIVRRLRDLNPRVAIEAVAENVTESNAARLVSMADVVVDAAPLFEERLLLNRESVRQRKPMVECAVYELEAHVTTFVPGKTGCLACHVPAPPASWKRRFPVFGAVSGLAGCAGAMEVVKLVAGLGEPLLGRMLVCGLRDMRVRTYPLERDPRCAVCGGPGPGTLPV
jgi:molybdopterin/thiamine biosynthesis adenylyltransferase